MYLYIYTYIYGGFHKWGIQNGWFIIENPIKMDDVGVTLFQTISGNPHIYIHIYIYIWMIMDVYVSWFSKNDRPGLNLNDDQPIDLRIPYFPINP